VTTIAQHSTLVSRHNEVIKHLWKVVCWSMLLDLIDLLFCIIVLHEVYLHTNAFRTHQAENHVFRSRVGGDLH
jgi:hypothetical protein